MANKDKLLEAFDIYVVAPTQQNLDDMMAVAIAYRESWIEARAAGVEQAKSPTGKSDPPTRYKRIFSVEETQPDGTELTLALQSRTSERQGATWYVVSWRTRLSPGGTNRRFYVSGGVTWSLNAVQALAMLEKMEEKGGLDEQYFDQRAPDYDVTTISSFDADQPSGLWEEITMTGDNWGKDPFYVVLDDPLKDRRKVLIVNRETEQATFRTMTKDESYMPRKTLRPGSDWFLDNSMQDTNVQQARSFLAQLREITSAIAKS